MNEKKIGFKNIIIFIVSIFAIISLNINLDISKGFTEAFSANSVVWILVLFFSYWLLSDVSKIDDKRLKIICIIIAVILALMEVVGNSLDAYLNLDGLFYNKRVFVRAMCKVCGFTLVIYSILCKLFWRLKELKLSNIEAKYFTCNKRSFLLVWLVIFIAWIPYLLKYYPGIITPDSFDQICQGLGLTQLTNHHPVTHTAFIAVFMNIGKAVGNYNLGVALYSIFQMLILSSSFSFGIYYMAKKNIDCRWRIISLLFLALYPVNGMYSITMWKDIPFAVCMLIFVIMLYEIVSSKGNFFDSKKNILLFVLSMISVILFRNNGIYVVVLTLPIILLAYRKYYKKITGIFLFILCAYAIWKGPVFNVLGVEKGSSREALSIPLQQFARIVKEHSDELTDEEKENIHKYLKTRDLDELYDPRLSDNVKATFDDEYFKKDKKTFITTWAKLCFKYPKTAVESLLCNSYGYWYPEFQYWVVARSTVNSDNDGKIVLPIEQQSLLENARWNNYDSFIEKRNIPIISMLFSIGFVFWLVVVSFGYVIYKKEYKKLLIFVPVLVLWLTCLASPVSGEYRYMYAMFAMIPILIGISLINNKEVV